MKSRKVILCAVLGLFFLVSGCQEDRKNGDYSGVSDLIADRNRARYGIKKKTEKKPRESEQAVEADKPLSGTPGKQQKDTLSSVILYEEKVEIVGSNSGRTLASGVAYINKQGRIVRIKISKE